MSRRAVSIAVVALASAIVDTRPAAAQENSRFAVGLNFTQNLSRDDRVGDDRGVGIAWRFGQGSTGWGWHYGLGWYETHLQQTTAGQRADIGELHIRPLVAGYGYTHRIGRLAITGKVLAGAALTTFNPVAPAAGAGDDSSRSNPPAAQVGVIPIVKPVIGTWYDINRRFGVSVNLAYIVARPTLEVMSSTGRESRAVRADMLILQSGIVYSVW